MNEYFNNTKKFVNKCIEVHNNFYNYSLVNYVAYNIPVDIICPIHGVFQQKPTDHKDKKRGCQKCGIEKSKFNKKNLNNFITESNSIHLNKYNYSLSEYKNIRTKIIIICPIHGEFTQLPSGHLKGKGCKICNSSKGEIKISNLLNLNNINYRREEKFEGCVNKYKLRFDFYLPDYNICIEYDGEMHFKEIEKFGGKIKIEYYKKNDNIKSIFCEKNNIKLFRIKYDQDINNEIIKILEYGRGR